MPSSSFELCRSTCIRRNARSAIFSLLALFWVFPSLAFAVDIVTAWNDPAANTNYPFASDIEYRGQWSLPPNWLGNIYFYFDGAQVPDKTHATTNCLSLSTDTTGCYYTISNVNGGDYLDGSFNFNIGPRPDGVHSLQIKFWGGEACAVKAEINAYNDPDPYPSEETCAPTKENFYGGQIYPSRTFTINIPVNPRFKVTPASDPAYDFSIMTGQQNTLRFYVNNTGANTLTYSIDGISAPYYCKTNCPSGAVASNATATVEILFVPQNTGTYDRTLTFNCGVACDISSLTRNIKARATGEDNPPAVSITSGSPLDFGFFYYLNTTSVDKTVTIKNSGGGLLNGTINLPSSEYACVSGCNYSLFAGDSVTKTIRFTPSRAEIDREDTAHAVGGGSDVPFALLSDVSDVPVVMVRVIDSRTGLTYTNTDWVMSYTTNIGATSTASVSVRNAGGGTLTGSVSGLPDNGYSFAPNATYVANGGKYVGLIPSTSWTPIGSFQFSPTVAATTSAVAHFSNTVPDGSLGRSIVLTGAGNDLPIASVSLSVINFNNVLINTLATTSMTVKNVGLGSLNVGLVFGSTTESAFACIANCTEVLLAGESTVVVFAFIPAEVRNYSQLILVGGRSVELRGQGVQPGASFRALDSFGIWNTLPLASGAYVNYGTTIYGYLGSDTYTRPLRIESTGGSGTRVNYRVDLSSAPHFVCASCSLSTTTLSVDLWPFANSVEHSITFDPKRFPSGPGTYEEEITVWYDFNDGATKSVTYAVKGSSVADAYMVMNPITYSFGNILTGDSATTVFTIVNKGLGNLTGTITKKDPADTEFTCIDPVPCELVDIPYNGTTTVTFRFNPLDASFHNAEFEFLTNGGNRIVTLSGTGLFQPIMKLTPSSVSDEADYTETFNYMSFDDTNLGYYSEKTIRIWNVGRGNLVGNVVFTAGGGNFSCQPPSTGCSYNIPDESSGINYRDITVRFAPVAIGSVDGQVSFMNASNNPPTQTVTLHGKGVFKSIINILGSGQTFAPTVVGRTREQYVILENSGTVDFPDGFFSLSGPFTCVSSSAGPNVDGKCPYHLAGNGGTTAIRVRFTPLSVGVFTGMIDLSTLPFASFPLNGTGVPPSVQYIER